MTLSDRVKAFAQAVGDKFASLAPPYFIPGTSTTVGALPAAGTAGRRSFVTDANATTFASVVAGGGSNKVPVYDDGTSWRIG